MEPGTFPNERLKQARELHGWSQKRVAELVGAPDRKTVARWESGRAFPSPHYRERLCEVFGKGLEELGLLHNSALPIWNVPYLRNPHFTGRDELLERLDQHLIVIQEGLPVTRRAALTQPQAIKGLGGIGKTQIAVEYAYRAREQGHYTHTFWVNAAGEDAILTSLVTIAEMLLAFPETGETDQRKLAKAIIHWLEQCQESWLLIFDNTDDISLIQEFLPKQGNGSILLTTRSHAVSSFAVALEVETMGLIEGTQLLLHRAQHQDVSDEERDEAINVVIALDCFPLALDQAGAYIEETNCSFAEYLKIYQDHRNILLARRGYQATNYPDSVATTWSLSFQQVEQANPAATELLRLCAYLAPDRIPEELIKDGAGYWTPLLQKAASDSLAFNQMIAELLKFSLMKRMVEDQTLSLHRLVQAVQIDTMELGMQRQWAKRVVLAVNEVFPHTSDDATTWSRCLRYLEQVQACDTLIRQHKLVLSEATDLLERAGDYLQKHASYTIAEPLYQHALSVQQQQMASSLNGLANLYREQGKYAKAEPLFQQALLIWEQQGDPSDLNIARPLNGLAALYAEQGKYAEAEPLYLRALSIWEQYLEAESLQVTNPLNGLANLYVDQGRYAEAEPLYLRALSIWKQRLGTEHPNVGNGLNGLAELYRLQGRYAEAEPLYLKALSICEQQLGTEHPYRANILNNLAILHTEQGRYAEAESLFQQSFFINKKLFGLEHPMALNALNNLAEIYRLQGRYAEAEPRFQQAIRIWEQKLSPDDPNIARPLNGLAALYIEQSKYTEAEPLLQYALQMRNQSLGAEHPEVANALNDLAELYRWQGKYAEAEPLYQRALSIREQMLKPEHPDTAETMFGLGKLREAQGNNEEAKVWYARSLAIREQVFGVHHPKTTEIGSHLRAVLVVLGQVEEIMRLDIDHED